MKRTEFPDLIWLETALQSVRDAIIATDASRTIVDMNAVAESLTGWKRAAALHAPLESVLKLADYEATPPQERPIFKEIYEGTGINLAVHTILAKDGQRRVIEVSLSPVRREAGNVVGFVVVFRTVASDLEMQGLLKSIVTWAVALLRADAGDISLYDEGHDEIRYAASIGFLEEYSHIKLKPGEGLAGRVIVTGEPIIIEDYFAWEGRSEAFKPARPFSTVLKVPLKWQDKVVGVLGVDADSRRRVFNRDDVRLAMLFANVAAVAINNARLNEELQDRMQRLKRILEQEVATRTAQLAYRALQLETSAQLSREITSILDIDQLLDRVVELIRQAFNYYYVEIFMVDSRDNRLVFRSGTGELGRQFRVKRPFLEIGPTSLNGEAARTNGALVANRVSENPHFLAEDLLPETRSELVVPLRIGQQVIGTLDVQSNVPDAFSKEDVLVIQNLGDQVAIAIENAKLYEQSRKLAVLEERHRLARELHDSVTQSLFSLDLHSKAICTYLRKDLNIAEAQLTQMRQITHDTLAEMRSLIYDLRPSTLEEAGLVAGLTQLTENLQRPNGPPIVIHTDQERRLPAEMEKGLFRIAQEALNNALKHANAGQIKVDVRFEPTGIWLSISDDGRGFDPAAMLADCHAFGLVGMKERVALLRGNLEIASSPGRGTCISVRVPAQEKE